MINLPWAKGLAVAGLVTSSLWMMTDINQASALSAEVIPDSENFRPEVLLANDHPQPVRADFSRYTYSERYSIEIPSSSYLNNTGSGYLIVSNYAPRVGGCCFEPGTLKTDISIADISFEQAVSNAYVDDSGMAGRLLRVEELTVDGLEARRFWTVEGDNGADAIVTLVRYSETETAYVVSFFATGDTSFTDTIQAIHDSFRALNDR